MGLEVGFGFGHVPHVTWQTSLTRLLIAAFGWAQNRASWPQVAGAPYKLKPVTAGSEHPVCGAEVGVPAAIGCCSRRQRSEAPSGNTAPGTLDMLDDPLRSLRGLLYNGRGVGRKETVEARR